MASAEVAFAGADEEHSPHQRKTSMEQALQSLDSMSSALDSLDMRADPDAQATVTDFLDFTEYLPADMMRSLTLIGQLDQRYVDASTNVHELATKWGQLPAVPQESRTAPVQLRAEISENLQQAVNSRIYSHAEAQRMQETVYRHYNRAKAILAKLTIMLENYAPVEEQAPASKSPQTSRAAKVSVKPEGQKGRRPRVPRITVPGDVLAPYDLDFDDCTSESDISSPSSDEADDDGRRGSTQPARATPGTQPRTKLLKNAAGSSKSQKIPKSIHTNSLPAMSTSLLLSQLKPPPENAVIGSPDAPWGQLTPYELAKLRKRMKKNAAWAPSETMIARELKILGRGMDAYRDAKKAAEQEGRSFDGALPVPIVDPDTGMEHMPLGSLSIEALTASTPGSNLSNRGMKLNEAKKLKHEQLAKLAAEEAEESARKMAEVARAMFDPSQPNVQDQSTKAASKAPAPKKRKRNSVSETGTEKLEANEPDSQRPPVKRTKTETPVPPPHLTSNTSQIAQDTPSQPSQRLSGASSTITHSTTPIPPPVHGQDHNHSTRADSVTSPTPSNTGAPNAVTTTIVPLKPAADTAVPAALHSPKKSTTPILPPARETRKTARKQEQQKEKDTLASLNTAVGTRSTSPAILTPKPEPDAQPSSAVSAEIPPSSTSKGGNRPGSRSGKAPSQEPSLAADRPRRASTARNTPAPERAEQSLKPAAKRGRRPAPGPVSRTNSGGNSAVGARKAAPKKKSTRAGGKGRGDKMATAADATDAAGTGDGEIEVDDEGKPISSDEPRYCLCNRVSFGTMIQCDNVDNCKQEWFHLECVGLTTVPARTTKWYCPDCRKLLNIGEKGEVTARGVRA